MKRLLLFAGLLGLFTGVALAQTPPKPRYERIKPSAEKSLFYAEILKQAQSQKYHVVPDRLKMSDHEDKLLNMLRPGPPVYDSMPVLKPKGYHHAIIIKPDTSIDFKLIIKKP